LLSSDDDSETLPQLALRANLSFDGNFLGLLRRRSRVRFFSSTDVVASFSDIIYLG
jgi:hypothetical protein